jgi:hypothetical protein
MGLIKSRFIIHHRANNLTPNRANHKGFILRALSGIGSENSLGAHDIQLPGMRAFHTSMPLSSFLASSSEVWPRCRVLVLTSPVSNMAMHACLGNLEWPWL